MGSKRRFLRNSSSIRREAAAAAEEYQGDALGDLLQEIAESPNEREARAAVEGIISVLEQLLPKE
jgi:hypothetical protein